ncbi:MAG: YitT family protein [Clostridium cochlearium]|uniref:YitT family protein n=1 Tax=Clostridium cochlearium TaxID=1494 RepID=UPI00280BE193|nr:YitT family protein [Clostridium cochlearium]MDU1442634.1 YitT family protein [Clostridium cochlearium]
MKRKKEYILITIGTIFVALATKFFLAPNRIAAGGVIGLAIIINKFIPYLNLGFLSLLMNIILFIVAIIYIGGKFGGKTIYTSLSLSLFIALLDIVLPAQKALTNDLFLATIFGVAISGVGMGIVFNQNASTGGTDIIAKIINKFFHLPIGKSLLIVDFLITIFSALSFGIEVGMYSLFGVILNGFVIDTIIDGIDVCKQVLIISNKNDLISQYIIEKLERGCTIIEGKGGYTKEKTYILYSVLNRGEFVKLKEYIKTIDSRAFITVGEVREVLGEGFGELLNED